MATADELRQQLMTMIQAGQITPGYSTINDPNRTDPWSFRTPQILRPGDLVQDGESPQYASGYQFAGGVPGQGATIDPRTGAVSFGGQTYTPDEFQGRFVDAQYTSGQGFGPTTGNMYLVDTQTGNIVGDEQYQTTGRNWVKDVILPAAAIWGGSALLGSMLGGGAAAGSAGSGAASAAGSAGSAGTAGTLGATYVPTAISPIASAPITGGLSASAAALPEFTALGGSLGGAGLGAAGSAGSSATKAALYGDAGYGAGMTGAQTGAYDSVLGATGSKGLANAAANLPGLSSVGNVVSSLGGLGNVASLAGGLLGASDAGKGTTVSSQNQIDPRMAQYLYGSGYGDTNSLLGAAQQQFQQNRTGLNALQQQALDMQKNLLMSPEYTQGFNQIRSAGSGLLGQQVAANPFTSAQAGLLTQMPQQPTSQMAGFNPGSIQQLIAAGRGLLG